MKKFVALIALLIAGTIAAVAYAHVGNGTVTCNQATFAFASFPNVNNNVVQEKVYVDNTLVYDQPFSFNGPTGGNTVQLSITGSHSVVIKGSWNTNGEEGSFTGYPVQVSCSTVTVTVTNTVTNINTVTNVVTNTVTTPPVTTTVINTVTNNVTTTVPGPTKTTTVVRTHTIIKHRKLTDKQKCLLGHANGTKWDSKNHRCEFFGKG